MIMKADRFNFRAWNGNAWKGGGMTKVKTIFDNDFVNMPGVVIMQSTGLCDKNGKEIFEGDILRECAVVKWWENSAVFVADYDVDWDFLDHIDELEVIGNIYENPDLLKGGEVK